MEAQGRELWNSKVGGGKDFIEILLKLDLEGGAVIFQVDKNTGTEAWLSTTVQETGVKKQKTVFLESKVNRGEQLVRQVSTSQFIKVFQCHATELGLHLKG